MGKLLEDIEKKYGADFGQPCDTKVYEYLESIGFSSLAELLKGRNITN